MGAGIERNSAPAPRPSRDRRPERPPYLQVKVYVVLRRVFRASGDRPNVEVLDVKLNMAAAQAIVDANAGTWYERHLADKRTMLSTREEPGS